jgi:hypothetical protein
MSCESPIDIFDAPVSCEQPAKCEGAKVDMPDALVEFFEAAICANAGR